jgi:hypothetical protein
MWLVLTLIILSVLLSFVALIKKPENLNSFNEKIFSLSLWTIHIQLLLGVVLYFISPKVHFVDGFMKSSELRFYGLEHPLMMIVAAILITVGYSKSKKKTETIKKNKIIFIFYTISLVMIISMIPWNAVLA